MLLLNSFMEKQTTFLCVTLFSFQAESVVSHTWREALVLCLACEILRQLCISASKVTNSTIWETHTYCLQRKSPLLYDKVKVLQCKQTTPTKFKYVSYRPLRTEFRPDWRWCLAVLTRWGLCSAMEEPKMADTSCSVPWLWDLTPTDTSCRCPLTMRSDTYKSLIFGIPHQT